MRDHLDRYYTPDHVAEAVVRAMRIPPSWTVVEPSVGGGAWVRALRRTGHTGRIVGVDLDPDACCDGLDEAHCGDWPDVVRAAGVRGDVVLGNPPYVHARDHLEAGLVAAPRVAFLLRGTFVELTRNRADLWARLQPTAQWIVGGRLRFATPGGLPATSEFVASSMLFFSDAGTAGGWPTHHLPLEGELAAPPPPWPELRRTCGRCGEPVPGRRRGGARAGEGTWCSVACRQAGWRRGRAACPMLPG